MTVLSRKATNMLRDGWGISRREWIEAHGHEGRWYGDRCGCPDDQCAGHHHDEQDPCGCLETLAEELHQARLRREPCPLGQPMTWLRTLYDRVDVHVGRECALPYLLDAVDDVPYKARQLRDGAHTHFPRHLPDGHDKPLICIPHELLYDGSCECGFGYLFWHEVAHALAGSTYPAHGPEWQLIRRPLGHSAIADIAVHEMREAVA